MVTFDRDLSIGRDRPPGPGLSGASQNATFSKLRLIRGVGPQPPGKACGPANYATPANLTQSPIMGNFGRCCVSAIAREALWHSNFRGPALRPDEKSVALSLDAILLRLRPPLKRPLPAPPRTTAPFTIPVKGGPKYWYGWIARSALAASRRAACCGESSTRSAARLAASWDAFVAPTRVDVTPGRRVTQARATCAGGCPTSAATASSASRIAQFLSVNFPKTGLSEPLTVSRRPSPVPVLPSRRYLPVRKPLASGLQGFWRSSAEFWTSRHGSPDRGTSERAARARARCCARRGSTRAGAPRRAPSRAPPPASGTAPRTRPARSRGPR